MINIFTILQLLDDNKENELTKKAKQVGLCRLLYFFTQFLCLQICPLLPLPINVKTRPNWSGPDRLAVSPKHCQAAFCNQSNCPGNGSSQKHLHYDSFRFFCLIVLFFLCVFFFIIAV